VTIKERIGEHQKFWKGEQNSVPLVSYRIGNYFWSTYYEAAKKLLVKGSVITPDMIDVDSFKEDYLRQFALSKELGQTGFWTAEPFTGIPWMEAFWGCTIVSEKESFTARPLVSDASEVENLHFSIENNPWVDKYFEFIDMLVNLSYGQFEGQAPIGAPILRGPGDTAGAIIGQTDFIYALYEEPDAIHALLDRMSDSLLQVYRRMAAGIPDFEGGSSIGLYHIWAPGQSIWFQDDISALLSPPLFRDFLLPCHKKICKEYSHNMMHLHPSSFHLLNDILENEFLASIEINKDSGGPDMKGMTPQFKQTLDAGKRLVVWGDLTPEDIAEVYGELAAYGKPPAGVYYCPVEETMAAAEAVQQALFIQR
jgi:hypothetical protein